MKFRVVLPRFKWWRCLTDIADCVAGAIESAGHSVEQSHEFQRGAEIEIVLGAHEPTIKFPDYPVVIYQTEVPGSPWFSDEYKRRLSSALTVWEAAPGFVTQEAARTSIVPLGRVMSVAAKVQKDIGLLFYGSLSPRRVALLERLENAGLRPSVHFGVFGEARNALIDRSLVVVDIKQNEGDPDDPTRTFFLDSRGACVLSENDADPKRKLAPWNIVEQCKELLSDSAKREAHAAARASELTETDARPAIIQLTRILREVNRFKVIAGE